LNIGQLFPERSPPLKYAEFAVGQFDGARVHILVEEGSVASVHSPGIQALACPYLSIGGKIPDFEEGRS
jgi:hypothetical protein